MTHPWLRLSGCEGKAPLTWAQAREILGRKGEAHKGKRRVAYHCPVCRAWHIGRPRRKPKPLSDV